MFRKAKYQVMPTSSTLVGEPYLDSIHVTEVGTDVDHSLEAIPSQQALRAQYQAYTNKKAKQSKMDKDFKKEQIKLQLTTRYVPVKVVLIISLLHMFCSSILVMWERLLPSRFDVYQDFTHISYRSWDGFILLAGVLNFILSTFFLITAFFRRIWLIWLIAILSSILFLSWIPTLLAPNIVLTAVFETYGPFKVFRGTMCIVVAPLPIFDFLCCAITSNFLYELKIVELQNFDWSLPDDDGKSSDSDS